MGLGPTDRPLIHIRNNLIYHKTGPLDNPVRIVMSKSMIRVGCTDIDADAAILIMAEYEKRFGTEASEIVIQSGPTPC